MHKTMHQVLVLGQEISRGRIVVVRPDHRIDRRIGESRGHSLRRVRVHAHIGIQEKDDVAGGCLRSDVPCHRRTLAAGCRENPNTSRRCLLNGTVVDPSSTTMTSLGAVARRAIAFKHSSNCVPPL